MIEMIIEYFMLTKEYVITNTHKIESVYSVFVSFTKTNPVIGGMFGVWFLGIVTYIVKAIPNKISNFVTRYATVTATFSDSQESFHDLLKWFEKTGKADKMRSIRVSNGKWGYNDSQMSVGLGNHYFWYKFRLFKMNRKIENSNGGNKVKEEISISTFGFTQKILKKLILETVPEKADKVQSIKTWTKDGWAYLQDLDSRPLQSVILKNGQKNRIINFIKEFKDNKNWYVSNGIPYRTGVIFSGPPGTGKTSLVRAIGSYLKKDLCIINCDSVSDNTFQKALGSTPKNSIVLLEDFDSVSGTISRDGEGEMEGFGLRLTLSGILNAIDGVFSSQGRIVIATTNHLEKLDPAITRPGRFDLKEVLGHVDEDMALRLYNKFFPENQLSEIKVSEKISPAQVENCFLINKRDPLKALKAIKNLKPKKVKQSKITPSYILEDETVGEVVVDTVINERCD